MTQTPAPKVTHTFTAVSNKRPMDFIRLRGLSVEEVTELRRKFAKADVTVHLSYDVR